MAADVGPGHAVEVAAGAGVEIQREEASAGTVAAPVKTCRTAVVAVEACYTVAAVAVVVEAEWPVELA